MKDFAGKVCFITGGASGAGLGQAKVFAKAGMKVVICDIRDDHLEDAKAQLAEYGDNIHLIKMDLMKRDDWKRAADECEAVYGTPPQLFIQTAGVNSFGPAEASTFEDFDWIVGVDLLAVINGLVTMVPRMIKAGLGGHIVTVASFGAFMGIASDAPYCCAKAGVVNLMESYMLALKPYGIGATCLCPGNINSHIYDSAMKTRPAELANTGYHVSEASTAAIAKIHASGIDPVELAEMLKKAIEDGLFLLLPFPEPDKVLAREYERWINYTTLEGMERIRKADEEKAARRAEMAKNAPARPVDKENTFGLAKEGITYVNEANRYTK